MTTWHDWLHENASDEADHCNDLRTKIENRLGESWMAGEFAPTTEDRRCAWLLHIQLRSRITSQELPYLDGDEAAAISSVHKLFDFTRGLCNEHGVDSLRFSQLAWAVIDLFVRDVTAKWHKPILEKRLTVDSAHDLRSDLKELRRSMSFAMYLFESLATNTPVRSPPNEPSVPDDAKAGQQIRFNGILFSDGVLGRDDVLKAERQVIYERRNPQATFPTCEKDQDAVQIDDLTGLALSGGGLRSATFALGALQALAEKHILKDFDYLSTVSGGGYAGSFLSCYLNTDDSELPEAAKVGLDGNQLPFARQEASESLAFRHLRLSGQSLLAGSVWRKLEIPVLAFVGWVASLLVLLPPLLLIACGIAASNLHAIHNALTDSEKSPYEALSGEANLFPWPKIVIGVTGMLLFSVVWLAMWNRIKLVFQAKWYSRLPTMNLRWTGLLLLTTVFTWLVYLFPYSITIADRGFTNSWKGESPEWLISIVSALGVPAFGHLASQFRSSKFLSGIFATFARVVLPALLIWGVTVLICRHVFFANGTLEAPADAWPAIRGAALAACGIAAFVWFFLDINDCSLHPFYRDRLSRAFQLRLKKDKHQEQGSRSAAVQLSLDSRTRQKLSQMREFNKTGPFHLINASLNAQASRSEKLRGRKADFFVFSSTHCGSESTGYATTKEYEKSNRRLDLATAAAISGAAVSPIMGVRTDGYTFWAALLNIRLDFWLRNPRVKKWWASFPGPVYWLNQYLGRVAPTTPFVNLSDGGHIENIGLYELLRRRCRYIVVIDGECDPGITCGSFLQAMRYAKIDFGIKIDIDLSRLKFGGRARNAVGENASVRKGKSTVPDSPVVDYHFTLGKINYPQTEKDKAAGIHPATGLLLYLKSSISGNEDASIQSYRDRNPAFPHQSTADLAYDEEQFECYRSLGEHIVEDAFRSELVDANSPEDIAHWLQSLEKHLIR